VSRKMEAWSDWKIGLAVTIVLRVLFSTLAAVFSFVLHPDPSLIQTNALTENLPVPGTWHYALLGVWEKFDALWYLEISQHGYALPMSVIFYPLYPALIWIVSRIMPAVVAGLLVSTVAAFFFFVGLLRLSNTNTEPRLRLLVLVSVWPTSFILFAGYAESIAAALIVWAVAFARENRWWPAAICGFLAGLARPSGVLVSIPLFLMAWQYRRILALPIFLVPMGTLFYWSWLRWSGRLSVVEAYRLYQRTPFAAPWTTLGVTLREITHGDALLAIKLALIVLALWFSLRPNIRFEDKMFAIAAVLQMLMYTGRPIIGAPRYVLMVYPAFLGWAALTARWNAKQRGFYLSAFGFLNLVWMCAFFNWSLVL
jgi:hypothetical protein